MFGFQSDESAETVARKKGHMKDAQARWRFATAPNAQSADDTQTWESLRSGIRLITSPTTGNTHQSDSTSDRTEEVA